MGVSAGLLEERGKKKTCMKLIFNKMNFISTFFLSAELLNLAGFLLRVGPCGTQWLTICQLNIGFNVQWETFRKPIN